ncbi:MAG: alpha/beta hydrolase [Acidobacteria bacterium]|nr:alpha/beta hydrolase [Acidobacteriota bacterium]
MKDLRAGAELLDRPEAAGRLLFPHHKSAPDRPDAVNHFIRVEEEVRLGCRFFKAGPGGPNILFFHGNGETAADYDCVAPLYLKEGLNLFAAEYRGYGTSGGSPSCSRILYDTDPVFEGFRAFLRSMDYSGDLFVMGRSLGSAPAIETAYRYQSELKGLIVESGFASVRRQLERLGLSGLIRDAADPVGFGNDLKIAQVRIPTLIIHGEADRIIPAEEGRALYALSGAAEKRALFIPNAGHNDLLERDPAAYMDDLRRFTQEMKEGSR